MTQSELRSVVLRRLPVRLWADSRRWFQELIREFAIISAQDSTQEQPRDLVEFVAEVEDRMSRFAERRETELEDALASDEEEIDLTMELPPDAADLALGLWDRVTRANEYCRTGDLLTLQPDEEVLRFIRWYLLQVVDQLRGGEPSPWPGSDA